MLDYLKRNFVTRRLFNKVGEFRGNLIVSKIIDYLPPNAKILDIGAGNCNITQILDDRGFEITPIDVVDLSFVKDQKPIIYDGKTIPFKTNSFDVSLLLLVLHHTPNPKQIIQEAKRVSKNIVIMEEIFFNTMQKHLTYTLDSIMNLEFASHPHSNKVPREWETIFEKQNLRVKDKFYHRSSLCPILKQITYFLEKNYEKK
jgi:2-polyprenyl-3-methyl-5-hydroxy-6-metoxy-1,4-benzoquinol methylase